MSTVPEINDPIDASSSIEVAKTSQVSATVAETTSPSSAPVSTTQNEDKTLPKTELPQSPPPLPPLPPPTTTTTTTTGKQHVSRLSHFHRNTIHVCDQIVDRVYAYWQPSVMVTVILMINILIIVILLRNKNEKMPAERQK